MGAFGEFERYDAVGLAKLVRDKQVTPAELLDAAIERVERRNADVNAVVSRLYEETRRAIAAGLPDGPFTGVPFLLKDIGALLTGTATTFGSRMFTTFVADHDSELVPRYRRSGLVIFGKTNTPEFGIVATTEPQLLWGAIAFTSLFNASGSPAMSVPLHWTRGGLPVGVQFVSGFGEEARLFRLAAQLEAAQP